MQRPPNWGDATELETLGEVLGPKMPPGKRIAITSVKANIGHSLEAAGVAGLIKTILCMQHQTIPPAINLATLNPKIDWKSAPYYIPQTAAALDGPGRRRTTTGGGQCFRHWRIEHARRDRRVQRNVSPQIVGQQPSAIRTHWRQAATVRRRWSQWPRREQQRLVGNGGCGPLRRQIDRHHRHGMHFPRCRGT